VILGLEVVRAIAVGEPPADPDLMTKVRVAADIPEGERPKVEVLDETGAAFQALVEKTRTAKGADFTVCDVEVVTR
jgi:peptidylprolyl isomerase